MQLLSISKILAASTRSHLTSPTEKEYKLLFFLKELIILLLKLKAQQPFFLIFITYICVCLLELYREIIFEQFTKVIPAWLCKFSFFRPLLLFIILALYQRNSFFFIKRLNPSSRLSNLYLFFQQKNPPHLLHLFRYN